jgi:uncharacterized small protein (DUF1192 family)
MEDQTQPQGFNLVVTYRDEKTGLVTHTDPYTLRVLPGPGGGKARYWERPAGSGNLFDKKGQPAGRWDRTKPEGQRFDAKAAHVAFARPETEDAKLARSVIEKDAHIAELKRELEAIRAEREDKKEDSSKKSFFSGKKD